MIDSKSESAVFGTLYRVARTVNSSLDIMQVLQTIVASTAEALDAKACSLRLLGPDGKHLLFGAAHGLSPNYRAKGTVDVAHSEVDRLALSGWTLDNRCPDRCLARIDVIHETAPQWGDEHKHLPAVGTVSIGSVPQF